MKITGLTEIQGKYTVDELIKFFKTKVPLVAEKEKQLLSNCYFRTEVEKPPPPLS